MKDVLIFGGVIIGGWFLLQWINGQQTQAAMASCGLTPGMPTNNCAALTAVNQRWAWLPSFQL